METVAILERELYEVKINLLAGGIVKVVLIENRPIGISEARSRSGARTIIGKENDQLVNGFGLCNETQSKAELE